MADWLRLRDLPEVQLAEALKAGTLEMRLGTFTMQIKLDNKLLLSFLRDIYRDAEVRPKLQDVTDVSLSVKAPNLVRKFFRPQVVPDPGFIVPAVPLPRRLAPLSFEMGLNLAIALKCCRFVNFHAAVVANDKGSILISAQSGGGKSTLCAALMAEGYRLLSDEFGLLSLDGTHLNAYPRPVSLKDESIDIVTELTGRDWISDTYTGTPKGNIAYRRVRPRDIEQAQNPTPAKLLLFPVFMPGAPPHVKKLTPSETVLRLIPASTNYHLLGEHSFNALVKMANHSEAYEIQYGSTEQSLQIVKDLAAGAGL